MIFEGPDGKMHDEADSDCERCGACFEEWDDCALKDCEMRSAAKQLKGDANGE